MKTPTFIFLNKILLPCCFCAESRINTRGNKETTNKRQKKFAFIRKARYICL